MSRTSHISINKSQTFIYKGFFSTLIIAFFLLSFMVPGSFIGAGETDRRSGTVTLVVNATAPGKYSTIQEAIDLARDGDIVKVESGTYRENLVVNTSIVLMGQGSDRTVIISKDGGTVISVTASDVQISDLYITGNYQGSGSGGLVVNRAQNVVMEGLNCSGNVWGVRLNDSSKCMIRSNVITTNEQGGIYMKFSHYNQVIDNTLKYSYIYGILAENSSHNTLEGNTINECGYAGILLFTSLTNTLAGNEMSFCGLDIAGDELKFWTSHQVKSTNTVNGGPLVYLSEKANMTITGDAGQVMLAGCDNISVIDLSLNSTTIGIFVVFSNDISISNNTCNFNADVGFSLYNSTNCRLENNSANNNNYHGFRLSNSNNSILVGNRAEINGGSGIAVVRSTNSSIINSLCSSNHNGVALYRSSNNTLVSNELVSNARAGLEAYASDNNTMNNNTHAENMYGSGIYFSHNNVVANSTLSFNKYGVEAYMSSGQEITGSTFSKHEVSIFLQNSPSAILKKNVMVDEGAGIIIDGPDILDWASHSIDVDNMVGGKAVGYLSGRTGEMVSGEWGQVILADCRDVVVSGLNISGASAGVQVAFSSDIAILNNSVSNCTFQGISVQNSTENHVSGNIVDGSGSSGIYFRNVMGINLTSNTCDSNTHSGMEVLDSSKVVVLGNLATRNLKSGVEIIGSGSTVKDNHLNGNVQNGLYLQGTGNDTYVDTIQNNSCNDNYRGIYVSKSGKSSISGNSLENNSRGIYLASLKGGDVANNYCRDNIYFGIIMDYSENCTISGNYVEGSGDKGISVITSYHINVSTNDCYGNPVGISLRDSVFCSVFGNSVMGGEQGIHCYFSGELQVEGNTADGNQKGIHLERASEIVLLRNICNGNVKEGLNLTRSNDIMLARNTCLFNGGLDIYISPDCDNVTLMNNQYDSINEMGILPSGEKIVVYPMIGAVTLAFILIMMWPRISEWYQRKRNM